MDKKRKLEDYLIILWETHVNLDHFTDEEILAKKKNLVQVLGLNSLQALDTQAKRAEEMMEGVVKRIDEIENKKCNNLPLDEIEKEILSAYKRREDFFSREMKRLVFGKLTALLNKDERYKKVLGVDTIDPKTLKYWLDIVKSLHVESNSSSSGTSGNNMFQIRNQIIKKYKKQAGDEEPTIYFIRNEYQALKMMENILQKLAELREQDVSTLDPVCQEILETQKTSPQQRPQTDPTIRSYRKTIYEIFSTLMGDGEHRGWLGYRYVDDEDLRLRLRIIHDLYCCDASEQDERRNKLVRELAANRKAEQMTIASNRVKSNEDEAIRMFCRIKKLLHKIMTSGYETSTEGDIHTVASHIVISNLPSESVELYKKWMTGLYKYMNSNNI